MVIDLHLRCLSLRLEVAVHVKLELASCSQGSSTPQLDVNRVVGERLPS